MRSVRIYSLYFLQFFKARLEYKADFFASLLASVVVSLVGILFVTFLIDGEAVKSLHGWSRSEVLFIYGYSYLATALFSTLAPNLYSFGDRYVIQGNFDRVLLRPLGTLPQVLCESFSLESLGNFFVGLVVLGMAKMELGITFSFIDICWLLFSALCGAVILLSVFVFLSSLSFHFEDRLGVTAPFHNLISFGRYPLTIYNTAIQFLLSWIIPFGFVAFYPATHFFSREGFALYCYSTPLVALASMLIAKLSWDFGVSRYSSTGN